MPGNADITIAQSIAITDPGEVDRDQHTRVDRFVIGVGNLVAWLFPLLIVAICAQVVLRKMGVNQAWLDDAQWWIYGFAMTVGFAYAITTQSHVRVDILHHHFSPTKKARIEVLGLGWLLLPFLLMMTDILFHYGWASFIAGEGSDSPNGLHRLYLLKISLPALFALAVLAAISILTRHLAVLTRVHLGSVLIAMFPASWFAAERLVFYILYWVIRATNPDIEARRISREPVMDHTIWIALALVLALIAFGFVRNRAAREV